MLNYYTAKNKQKMNIVHCKWEQFTPITVHNVFNCRTLAEEVTAQSAGLTKYVT